MRALTGIGLLQDCRKPGDSIDGMAAARVAIFVAPQIIVSLPGTSLRSVRHARCAVCGRGESYSLRGRDQCFWNFPALRAARNGWSRARNTAPFHSYGYAPHRYPPARLTRSRGPALAVASCSSTRAPVVAPPPASELLASPCPPSHRDTKDRASQLFLSA